MYYYFILLLFLTIAQADDQLTIQNAPDDDGQLFSVEGKISIRPEMQAKPNWFVETKVLLDYGKYAGFVRYLKFTTREGLKTQIPDMMALSKSTTFHPAPTFWRSQTPIFYLSL